MYKLRKVSMLLVVFILALSIVLVGCSPAVEVTEAAEEAVSADEPTAEKVAEVEEEPAAEEEAAEANEEVAMDADLDVLTDPLTEVNGPADGGKWKIGFSMSYFGNGWQTQNQNSMLALSETPPFKDKVEVIVTQSGADVQKQNAQLNELIAQGVDAILLFPISPDGLNQTIQEACDQGILVMTYSAGVTAECSHNVGVDYYVQGEVMAEWLVEQLDGKGKILMNHGVAGTNAEQQRNDGAMEIFDQYEDIEIVAEINGDWSNAVSQEQASLALAANPVIDGVWSEAGADGVIRAMLANDMPLVPTTGEGTNGFHRMLIDPEYTDQGLIGMSTADPGYDAALTLKLAIAALEGHEIPKDYIQDMPTVYPGEFVECDEIAEGCTVYPQDLVPDDWFVDMFRSDLPLTVTGFKTGKP